MQTNRASKKFEVYIVHRMDITVIAQWVSLDSSTEFQRHGD